MTRRIFVGDVQGCADEFEDLLDRLAFADSSDRLYLVGDVIGRGPAHRRALDVAERYASGIVLGNHEYGLLQRGFFAPARQRPEDWSSVPELARDPERERLGAWIAEWPLLLEVDELIVVHAALPPTLWPAHAECSSWTDRRFANTAEFGYEEHFALFARYCNARGERPAKDWPEPGGEFEPWDHFYRGERRVVFGHWARRGLHRGERVLGLDSGCVYGGALSAWIAEEDEIVQIPARRAYWPR